jgi:hypothetical protein
VGLQGGLCSIVQQGRKEWPRMVSDGDLEIEGVEGWGGEENLSAMSMWGECHSHTSKL